MSHRIAGLGMLRVAAISMFIVAIAVLPSLGSPVNAGYVSDATYGEGSIRITMDIDGVPHTGIFSLITSSDDPQVIEAALAGFAARFPEATTIEIDQGGGVTAQAVVKPYKWPDGRTTWGYNPAGAPAGLTGELAAFEAAAETWNTSGVDFTFESVGITAANTGACSGSGLDGHNTIGWRNQSDNILAVTCSWYVGAVAPKSSVEFDVEFDPDWDWTTGSAISFDVESIGVHEMGHALGLAHTPVKDAVMYRAYAAGANKRALHADDIAGATQIYGAAESTEEPAADEPQDSPGELDTGSGADGGGQGAGLPPPPDEFSIPSGANLMTWPYEDTPVTDLGLTGTDTVYAFDAASGSWLRYSPAFPKNTNSLLTLQQSYAYWFMTTDSIEVSAVQLGY